LALALIPTWLVLGHRYAEAPLRAELKESLGVEPTLGFVLIGPDLNLYAYDVRFEAEGLEARIPWAQFVIPFSRLWGEGATRAIRFRHLRAVVDEEADLSYLTEQDENRVADEPDAEGAGERDEGGIRELVGESIEVRVRDATTGELGPLFAAKRVVAQREGRRDFKLEMEEGSLAAVPFDGATMRIIPTHQHLIVSEFRMRTFGGIVGGLLDVHLASAGSFNGEVEWTLLDVGQICRHYEIPHAAKRRGKLRGRIRFDAAGPTLRQLRGSGAARLYDAHFWSPVSFEVYLVLGVPAMKESWLHGADLQFTVESGLCYLEQGAIHGAEYELDVQGLVEFGGQCDMEASYRGTTVAIRGRLHEPDVKVLPLDAVTLPFDRLFRTRLRVRGTR
jgi:hypothetical protein